MVLFGGYFVLFYQGLLKCGLYLQGGLYLEVTFDTGLSVHVLAIYVRLITGTINGFTENGT